MLSRFTKSFLSISPKLLLSTSKSLPKFPIFKALTLTPTPTFHFSTEEYLQDFSDYTMAQGLMKAYVKNQENSPKDIVQVFVSLERYKMGVISSEPAYKAFLVVIRKGLLQEFSSEELQVLVEAAHNMHIKDVSFWELIHQNLEKYNDNLKVKPLLAVYETLLKIKQYPNFVDFISQKLDFLKPKVLQSYHQFNLNDCVRAIYVFGFFEQSLPELEQKLKADLMNSSFNIDMLLTADQLASTALIVLNLPNDQDFDKERALRDIAGSFISRDMLEYDLTLQHYEYDSPTPGESGVRDRLRWESIAKMARVYAQEEFYDDVMINRLKETIFRNDTVKGLIDFENASVILSVYARARSLLQDNDFYSRILEMFHWQLNNEDNEVMLSQYDGKNMSYLLDALNVLANPELDPELLSETFNYFSGVIQGGQLDSKIKEKEWKDLLDTFQDARRFARFDQGVIRYLQDKIDLLAA